MVTTRGRQGEIVKIWYTALLMMTDGRRLEIAKLLVNAVLTPRTSYKDQLFLTRAPLGGGAISSPLSRFLAISSKPMQVSPPNLQYPLSQ